MTRAGAVTRVDALAVRFTMGAFELRVDGVTLLTDSGTGVLIGILGALPLAIKAFRLSVAQSLNAV